jgi:arabinofuranosyltransferase
VATALPSSDQADAIPLEIDRSVQRRRNLVAVVLVALLVLLAWQHRWTFDDGFINFRIVKQLEAGHGPVFNTGQRVEVFTSPVWLFILAFADVVSPIRIEWLSVFLGIAFTASGLAFSISASRRLWVGVDSHATELPIGAVAIVATAPIWYFATSGLEGGLTFAWLGLTLWILAGWATGSRSLSRLEWLVVGLGWLVRPELALFSLAAATAVVIAERSDRSLLRRIAATGWAWLLPVAYQLFRMGYFASLFPNTAYAKEAAGTRWGVGWTYLTQFVGNYWLWLAAACLIAAGYVPLLARFARHDRRRLAVVIAWLSAAFLVVLYIVRIGGDYAESRLLLPSFFAFCGPVAVTRVATVPRAIASVAFAVWAIFAAATFRPYFRIVSSIGEPPNVVTYTDALHGFIGGDAIELKLAGDFSFELHPIVGERNPALPKHTVALFAIGAAAYGLPLNVYVLDVAGLADPIIAHFELPTRGLPGHEKFEPAAWSAARLLAPGAIASPAEFAGPSLRQLILPTTGAAFALQVDEARQALQCGELRKLQDSYQGHLDVGRFIANIFHSFTYSRITIPPDPAAAARKFCPAIR